METDTVIVGNGPSAMILSYILHGHIPYYSASPPHPDPLLDAKLRSSPELLNADVNVLTEHFGASRFSYTTQALPVNVLLDTLVRPSADVDVSESLTNLEWRYMPEKAVPHIVFGNAVQPGGQWTENPVPASWEIQTLSYATMLSLPGYSYSEHHRRVTGKDFVPFTRPSRREYAEYLRMYPTAVKIDGVFRNGERVAGISRTKDGFFVRSHQMQCKHVVLATGIFSEIIRPSPMMEPLLSLPIQPHSDVPLLVIGSGFSAADVIISAPNEQKVIHLFKWDPDARPSPLRSCHQQAYPEYAGMYRLMKRAALTAQQSGVRSLKSRRLAANPFLQSRSWDDVYEGLANTEVVAVEMQQDFASVTFRRADQTTFIRKVCGLVYAVGRRGTLDYLEHDLLLEVLGSQDELESASSISAETLRSKAVEDLEVARDVFIVGSLTGDSLIRFAYGGCVYTAGKLVRAHAGPSDITSSCSSITTASRPATAPPTPLGIMNGIDGHYSWEVYDPDQKSLTLDREDTSRSTVSNSTEKPGLTSWWRSLVRMWK